MEPDIFSNKIAPDGTIAGGLCRTDLFFPAGRGPIFQSPNGNFWRLEVDDNGVLQSQQVSLTP